MTHVRELAQEAATLSDADLFARLHEAIRLDHQALDRLGSILSAEDLRGQLAELGPRRKNKAAKAGGEG